MSRPIPVGHEPPPLASPTTSTETVRRPSRPPTTRQTERFEVINTFVDATLRQLRGSEIAVWLILWRDTYQNVARVSQDWIAVRAGVNRRTVRRALKSLQSHGVVEVLEVGGLSRGPSRYRVYGLNLAPAGTTPTEA